MGSLHDLILFQVPGLIDETTLERERKLTAGWLESSATLVVSSNATVAAAADMFGTRPDRFALVPLSGEHANVTVGELPASWTWAQTPYILLPANIFPHKNHEVVLRALASRPPGLRLVLTGVGADLGDTPRGRQLRECAASCGLSLGTDVIPLGLVSDDEYGALLHNATALVMPSLAEGGGSFPVWEALHAGVPVVCSDIPVLREQAERLDVDLLFFDPHDPEMLAALLSEIVDARVDYRQRAAEQRSRMKPRTWMTVAAEYLDVFRSACNPETP